MEDGAEEDRPMEDGAEDRRSRGKTSVRLATLLYFPGKRLPRRSRLFQAMIMTIVIHVH
jgi:hypothetical protein